MQLWNMSSSIAAWERFDALIERNPPAFEWVGMYDYVEAAQALERAMGGDRPTAGHLAGVDLSSLPKPVLRCTDAGFAPEIIFWGAMFASERLVETLALDPTAVQLLDVDCSACPPAMQAKGYRLLNLLRFFNPMDRERSWPNDFTRFTRADGSVDYVWMFLGAGPNDSAPHVVWQDDLVVPAPLFRMPARSWTFATDELAERVIRAGFDEIAFHDITSREGLIRHPAHADA